jgi:ubiquitin-protein ligase E3 C
MVEKEFTDDE